ncbi:MAG TPA: SET domain-containing protein-lysine N-methyltransferase [Chlamydiales bacterium]|nr:SET domain-containing protein-lysine N-methyltransferase [Chlamydiales bacterium]
MKYRLLRQEIPQELMAFGSKTIKKQKVYVPRATKSNLREIAAISRAVEREGLPKHLVMRKLKGKIGYGIFLHPEAKPIERGEAIAPYSGVVYLAPQNEMQGSDYAFSLLNDLLLTREEQLRHDPKGKFHPRRLYSLDLDADKKGNFTRFINHSDKPNVEAQFLRIPTNSVGLRPAPFEIIYVAKKAIQPGEQLLICYDDEDKCYWGALKIKPFPMTPKTFRLDSALNVV